MGKQRLRLRAMGIFVTVAAVSLAGGSLAFATTPSSTNYQLPESAFGSSSLDQNCSGQYCVTASIGDSAVGETSSGTTTADFGSVTNGEPSLQVIVDPGVSDLGVLDEQHTGTKTMVVRVSSYLSNGYIVQIVGSPPKYGTHALATPSTPTASTVGTEQFGINTVLNTSPSVGADPVQVPSSAMSFGAAASGYNTTNRFQYTSGDVVASSAKQSGETDYTISMILNISSKTPAGHYSGDFAAVVTPVY